MCFVGGKWILETLLEAMDNKRPVSVLTDGDRAMRDVIENVLPGCKHCLCTCHFQRNAATNVHIPEFHDSFEWLTQMVCESDDFD